MDDSFYVYLKLDHDKVSKLFKLYETASSEKNKVEIINMINKELVAHAISEEETFYKALLAHRESKKDTLHAENEHEEIKNKLAALLDVNSADQALDEKVKALKKIVEHHVKEEEGKIFKEAKEVLSDEKVYRIKEEMHYLKGKILLENFPDE